MRPLEIWGGHECTVNRVGEVWRDQTVLSGHEERIDDLDQFAALGLRTLRYPVLWERTETAPGAYDWRWADARLERLRDLGVRPIVGLVHHGSGPAWTDLLDPDFASGLERFAHETARRYPWVEDWTPVNEPLTTARFSALYGHWYPHRTDERDFWIALLNQIEATGRAMRAIRSVNPRARLIQTEDFGWTWATPPCQSQANFENDRRLMTWDLQTGKVRPGHVLWERLASFGLEAQLAMLAQTISPPDALGLNHYVTSDRFLDHRLDRYPAHVHGGNGAIAYADVEAVRVLDSLPCGWTRSFNILSQRYGLPIAVTECHLGCDERDQARWLAGCWEAATAARLRGVQVDAVTAWSLLGSFDWDSLLTRDAGRYEPGAFSLSDDGAPARTMLASVIRDLAIDGSPDFKIRHNDGWWRQLSRLIYAPTAA